jgi:hypothetical protein
MIFAFFPLDANVWGTVADWMVAVAAVVSGVFLYSTLRSQIQVATLSENQYLRSIMPMFEISSHISNPQSFLDLSIKLLNNRAFETTVYVDGTKFSGGLSPIPLNMPVGYSYAPELGSKNYELLVFDDNEKDVQYIVSLQFFDSDHNLYEQTIVQDDYHQHFLTYPKMIKQAIQPQGMFVTIVGIKRPLI